MTKLKGASYALLDFENVFLQTEKEIVMLLPKWQKLFPSDGPLHLSEIKMLPRMFSEEGCDGVLYVARDLNHQSELVMDLVVDIQFPGRRIELKVKESELRKFERKSIL